MAAGSDTRIVGTNFEISAVPPFVRIHIQTNAGPKTLAKVLLFNSSDAKYLKRQIDSAYHIYRVVWPGYAVLYVFFHAWDRIQPDQDSVTLLLVLRLAWFLVALASTIPLLVWPRLRRRAPLFLNTSGVLAIANLVCILAIMRDGFVFGVAGLVLILTMATGIWLLRFKDVLLVSLISLPVVNLGIYFSDSSYGKLYLFLNTNIFFSSAILVSLVTSAYFDINRRIAYGQSMSVEKIVICCQDQLKKSDGFDVEIAERLRDYLQEVDDDDLLVVTLRTLDNSEPGKTSVVDELRGASVAIMILRPEWDSGLVKRNPEVRHFLNAARSKGLTTYSILIDGARSIEHRKRSTNTSNTWLLPHDELPFYSTKPLDRQIAWTGDLVLAQVGDSAIQPVESSRAADETLGSGIS